MRKVYYFQESLLPEVNSARIATTKATTMAFLLLPGWSFTLLDDHWYKLY